MVGKSPAMLSMVLSLTLHLVGLLFWPSSAERVTPQPDYFIVERWFDATVVAAPVPVDASDARTAPGLSAAKSTGAESGTIPPRPAEPPPEIALNSPSADQNRQNTPSGLSPAPAPPVPNPRRIVAQQPPQEAAKDSPLQELTGTRFGEPSSAALIEEGQGVARSQNSGQAAPSAASAPLACAGNPHPVYPARARQRGWEGNVLLLVDVSARGRVDRVTVLQSSGYELLDQAASQAVYRWRFHPARQEGRTIPGKVKVPIHYSLKN